MAGDVGKGQKGRSTARKSASRRKTTRERIARARNTIRMERAFSRWKASTPFRSQLR